MSGFPSPKILIFALGARHVYRSTLYSTRELFCGPDCKNELGPSGEARCLQTPAGFFDAAALLAATPEWQDPDFVLVKADATGRIFPTNLSAFHCPKILVVGNTQHLDAPIRKLLIYAHNERFDFVTSDHKRHHLHFFAESGFANVSWLPALNINPHRQPDNSERLARLLFVGQTGKFHPYRNGVLEMLRKSGLPIAIAEAPQAKVELKKVENKSSSK